MRATQAASAGSNSSGKSSARLPVSGVPGSSRARRRCASSLTKEARGAKPKSAKSEVVSMPLRSPASRARTRSRCSACRSSTWQSWRRRSTGAGVAPSVGGAVPDAP